MNKNSIVFVFVLIILFVGGCSGDYVKTEATIIDLKVNYPDQGVHTATIEYFVDGVRYTDEFEISVETLVTDSISTPAPGTKFEILYNIANPEETKIDFREKPTYVN